MSEIDSNAAWLQTNMGFSTPTTITVADENLADDLMGNVSLSALAFRFVAGEFPTDAELRLFDAVLVSLADHGITPSVLAARLTYAGAPEALQGAVAAGVLGGGSVFLGVVEDTARFLADILATVGDDRSEGGRDHVADGVRPELSDETLQAAASEAVAKMQAARVRTPGLGHPVHKEVDPRVPRLYELAGELGLRGNHLRLLVYIAHEHEQATGRRLPINGAGAAGAALAELGFDWRIVRGFALLARTAGLLGHLAEEMDQSMALPLWAAVDHAVTEQQQRRAVT